MSEPSLIFCDSWDHYNVITNKWQSAGTDTAIDLTGTKSRTGIGCLVILSAAFGPIYTYGNRTRVTVGTAYYAGSETNQEVIRFGDPEGALPVRVYLHGDGSFTLLKGLGGAESTYGQTAPNLYLFNQYNYVACAVYIHATQGSIELQVNGFTALSLTNLNTVIPGDSAITNVVQLMGAGAIADTRHDDTYIADWTLSLTAPFYNGAPRIRAEVPFADGAPIAWAPSTGTTHYTLVDEIPPNADTDYVSSETIGAIDQYQYNLSGVPAASQLSAVQHVLDMKIDTAGARQVASCVDGITAGTASALTTGYKMYTTPYDNDPSSGDAWDAGSFPASFGPVVTG